MVGNGDMLGVFREMVGNDKLVEGGGGHRVNNNEV